MLWCLLERMKRSRLNRRGWFILKYFGTSTETFSCLLLKRTRSIQTLPLQSVTQHHYKLMHNLMNCPRYYIYPLRPVSGSLTGGENISFCYLEGGNQYSNVVLLWGSSATRPCYWWGREQNLPTRPWYCFDEIRPVGQPIMFMTLLVTKKKIPTFWVKTHFLWCSRSITKCTGFNRF